MKVENSKGQELKGRRQIVKQVFEYLVIKSSPQAVTQRVSVKKVFLKISKILQESTCAKVFF